MAVVVPGSGAGGARPRPPASGVRREKENEAPKSSGGCGYHRKLADMARNAVSAATPAPRPRATSPTSKGSGGAGKRQALRALSPGRSNNDRLQAQLMRVNRALRDHEMPQEKAEILEGFLESLLPTCAMAPTPARAVRGDRQAGERQKAAGVLQQPPWKPATIVTQPPGCISRCRSLVKLEPPPPGGASTPRCVSPRRQQSRRAASPPPGFWDGPDAARGFSFPGPVAANVVDDEEAFAYGAPAAPRQGWAAGRERSPGPARPSPSHRPPLAACRQPMGVRCAGNV